MASELRVNTLKDAAGNNSIATSFVAGGSAKCWAISNAGAAASDSFNLASTTDNGAGDYTFAISSDMGSANYSHPIGASLADGGAGLGVSIASKAAGSLRIGTIRDDSTKTDCTYISLSILGDLA